MKPQSFNALEMARQALARRAALFPDEKLTIHERHGLRIYLSRFRELLLLTAVNGDPSRAERIGLGYYSPYSGWVVDLDQATYRRWAARAMRLAHTKENEQCMTI
jgi:hypothetical protein